MATTVTEPATGAAVAITADAEAAAMKAEEEEPEQQSAMGAFFVRLAGG